ncbi:MAG: response regulator [Gammaproteobacteria bacterium]|nr:response regulator [Gammaproteobacteria bacterium]
MIAIWSFPHGRITLEYPGGYHWNGWADKNGISGRLVTDYALNLPEMSGLEATRRIILSSPHIKILVLTAHRDIIYPFRLLRAGALGYLTKDSQPTVLIEAIQQVVSGENYLPSPLAKLLANRRFDKESDFPFDGLSDRELDVMLMLIEGKGTVEISRELRLGVSTVNCYRHRILKQLNVKNVVDLVHLAQKYQLIDSFK